MHELIRELKQEHKTILELLGQVRVLGIGTQAGQEQFLAARELLMAHMRKEDERYYPELRKAAERKNELKALMEYFLADMEAVSNKALRVYDRYAEGGDEAEFAGEVKMLYLLLRDRIRTEEETLFKKFPGETGEGAVAP